MKELISIIVPIYNSARYIRDCVASVLEQTYPYFELILVDDGSEDNSRGICQELCAQDERLSLITCRHGGVSAARNTGIEAAQGTYLFFLDSDDIIHPQLLEFLYRLMKERGAAVGTERRYRFIGEVIHKPEEWRMEELSGVENSWLQNEEALDCGVFASSETALCGIGGKMIRRNVLGNVRFHEKLTHGEDTLFMYQVLAKGADVLVLGRDWYCYRKHGGGTIDRLTVEGLSCIYRVECYIRNREIERGRIQNAVLWETAISGTVINGYETGQKNHDSALMRYAKSRAVLERKQRIFLEVRKGRRWEIALLAYCAPLRHIPFPGPLCVQIMRLLNRLISCPGIYYRKVLNLIHIHRWRIKWAYRNVRWKMIWAGQRLWLIAQRVFWKMIKIYQAVLCRREQFDDK